MIYSKVRDKIRSGDVLAWSGGGWGSLHDIQVGIVRMATRSEYSHVGVAWVVAGRVFVIEAVGSGVRIMPLSSLLPCYLIRCGDLYWGPLVEERAMSFVGQEYSKWQAIKAFFGKLKRGADSRWECAELVNYLLEVGFKKLPFEMPKTDTPSATVDWLLRMGHSIEKVESEV